MNDIGVLRQRYLQDPLEIQIGGLASNLSRIGWFMKRPNAQKKLAPIFRESKFFTEWAAQSASLEVQSLLAQLQIELAIWQHHIERGKIPVSGENSPEGWSQRLLRSVGLLA